MSLGRAARVIRGLWPDRNPLRRAHDRMEAVVVGVLLAAFLAGAPLAIFTAGRLAYNLGSRTAHAQQIARHRVPAVLLTAAPPAAPGSSLSNTRARWAASDGTRRTGMIPAPAGARAGSTVLIWVDATGQLTSEPMQRSRVWFLVAAATVLAFVLTSLIVLCIGRLARYPLDRRRLAAWDADWRATEPQWTGRR